MSDFGSISLPGRAAANQALGRNGQAVQIINLPPNLSNVAQALRLSGEVTQVNANGAIRIATTEGNIDAQVRNPNTIQTGQPISIEVPAGRPPQQATIRPPTIQTPTQGATQSSDQALPPAPDITIRTDRPAPQINAPREGAVRPEQSFLTPTNLRTTQSETLRPAPQIQNPAPLRPETVIRLIAVPPNQAQRIATEFAQTITTRPAIANRALLAASFFTQTIETPALNSALQTQHTAIPTTPTTQSTTQVTQPQTLIQNLQNTLQPLLNNTALQTPIAAASINLTAPTTSAIQSTPNLLQPTIVTPLLNPATPLPIGALTSPQIATPLIQNLSVAAQTVQSGAPTLPSATQQTTIQPALTTPLQQPLQASLIPTQITFDPANPAPIQNTPLGRIDIQIIAIQPPQANITALPITGQQPQQIIPATTNFTAPIVNTNNNAVTITAQVTGFNAQGLPLVTLPPLGGRTIPQSYVLQFNSNNLQLGSQLQIATQNPILAQQAQTTQPLNPLLRGFQFPALNQLYSTLFQLSPDAAASLTRSLPNPVSPAQAVSSAMMFIAAVKAGDITHFLGQQKADMIQRAGRENILRALSQDSGAQSARAVDAAPSGEWRAVPLPMFWENEIHKITLYTRQENEDNKEQNKEGNGQTRFVFDLNLTRMGEMQIDGYLKDNRLDLIIRAQNMFSSPMQQAMRDSYSNALDHTALKGELNFQGTTKNWVHVLEQNEQLGVDV